MKNWTLACAALLTGVAYTAPAAAGKPLWELGLGAAPLTFPAYRGSEKQKFLALPLPYVVYRGDFFRADRDGVRGRLFESDRVRLVVRGNGSIPVDSDEIDAREGMADLDPTFELGPSLHVRLGRDSAQRTASLRLRTSAVFSTDFSSIDYQGLTFYPHLNVNDPHGPGGWSLGANVGPMFATDKHHDYFYGVGGRDARPGRETFSAGGGYSGTQFLVSARKRFGRLWVGGFARYDYLGGAAFEDSPLVDTDHSFIAGIGLAWVFAASSRMVSDDRP